MAASSVCRVCLAGNIRMLKLDNVYLIEVFEKLTNLKLSTDSNTGMSSSICYICHRQLQKCHMFSEMACRSDRAMRVMLYSGIEITHRTITKLCLATASTLSVTPTQHTSVKDSNATNAQTTVKEEHGVVKIEETDYLNDTGTLATEVVVKIEKSTEFEETAFTPDEDTNVIDGSYRELFQKNVKDVENKPTEDNLCFCCDVCNKKVFSKYQLVKHLRNHNREKPYSCSLCGKKYVRKNNFLAHMQIHTREKAHSCNQCDKAFPYKSILSIHMRSHTGEKPYSCIRCNKSFTTKSDLTRHLQTHTGEKHFSCLRCNKAFTRNSDLAMHMRLHSGEKPHLCVRCDKTFAHKSNLTSHMQLHTGEPHSCNQCDKIFTCKKYLKTHMRIHTGKKKKLDSCKPM